MNKVNKSFQHSNYFHSKNDGIYATSKIFIMNHENHSINMTYLKCFRLFEESFTNAKMINAKYSFIFIQIHLFGSLDSST